MTTASTSTKHDFILDVNYDSEAPPMRTVNVSIACILCILSYVCAHAQLPDAEFSCRPRLVIGSMNGAIPMCIDTIILPTDPPPARAANSAYDRAARLRRMRWVNDVLEPAEELECKVVAEPPAAHVHLVLDYDLPTHDSDGTPIQYQIDLYCGFWFGDEVSDTTSVHFTTYSRYHAVAEARHVKDSSLLRSELLVSPVSVPPSGYAITTPITISAIEEYKDIVFDHWTSTHSGIAFDRYGREQRLSAGCWPMSDTARFTAWYRDNTTSSVLDLEIPETASVVLYDLQGRLAHFEYRDIKRLRGLYIAVITTADGTRIQPLLITH